MSNYIKMNLDQFFAQYNGRSDIDIDRAYGVQCVDLIKLYLRDCYGINAGTWGNAHAYYTATNPVLLGRFNRIANTLSAVPRRGDIIIWSSALPNTGNAGHIAIFDAKTAPGVFRSFDANWGGKKAHFVTHNYNNVIGWLSPKAAPPAPRPAPAPQPMPQGGNEMFRTDAEIQEAYYMLRGQNATAPEVAGWRGGSILQFILRAKPETTNRVKAKQATAVQLGNMQAQINTLNQTITKLTQSLQSSDTSSAQKQKALDDALGKLAETTVKLEAAHDTIEDVEKNVIEKPFTPTGQPEKVAKDPDAPNVFFKILSQLLTNRFKK